MIKLVSCEPPSLQESVWDTPELVGQAKQQLGELEDEILFDLIHFRGYLVCMLKKDDIFNDWLGDQLLGLLSYQNFDSSVGYSQIKSEPTMFVMLSYSWIFLEHTPLCLLGLTNTITLFT